MYYVYIQRGGLALVGITTILFLRVDDDKLMPLELDKKNSLKNRAYSFMFGYDAFSSTIEKELITTNQVNWLKVFSYKMVTYE
jgi:hypothetical protein